MLLRLLVLAATLFLCGCGGLYRGGVDLGSAAPVVQPIKPGSYITQDSARKQIKFEIDDGAYRLLDSATGETLVARIFGPISGLYVAQIIPEPDKHNEYGYSIIRIDPDGIHLADDSSALMGELLFSRLGIAPPNGISTGALSPVRVSTLTDNAHLNWALLQELIVRYREQLTFQLLYSADF